MRITENFLNLVGAAGLEPTTPRTQNECATNCATPRNQNF